MPEPEPDGGSPGWRRRLAQGTVLAGLAGVVAALALTLPETGLGSDDAGSTTRVEASDEPQASAALLSSDAAIDVDGRLADSGDLARPGVEVILPDPSGAVAHDAAGFAAVIEPSAATPDGADVAASAEPDTTTTTVFTEPTLPPESDWVDSGNGVLVPDLLLRIRFCESTNNYQAANGHSSARGAYQFLTGSWEWYGHAEAFGVGQAHLASPAQQDQAALATLQAEGTGPWAESRPCWNDPDIDPRYATATPPTTAPPASTTTTSPSESTTTTVDESSTTTESTTSTSTETTDEMTDESTTTTTETSSTETTTP